MLLPEKAVAAGGIVFSHSKIESNGTSTDMLPMAMTLAIAGAAVIIPDRSLSWDPVNATNREGAVVVCAERWLLAKARVFNDGKVVLGADGAVVRTPYAYVGPRICDPTDSSECVYTTPFSNEPAATAYIGETAGGDATKEIIRTGGLRTAQWLQRHVGLAAISRIAGSESALLLQQ